MKRNVFFGMIGLLLLVAIAWAFWPTQGYITSLKLAHTLNSTVETFKCSDRVGTPMRINNLGIRCFSWNIKYNGPPEPTEDWFDKQVYMLEIFETDENILVVYVDRGAGNEVSGRFHSFSDYKSGYGAGRGSFLTEMQYNTLLDEGYKQITTK